MIWQSSKFGFDVSIWQDNNQTPARIDFTKMRNYGASFVIIRSSVGNQQDEDYLNSIQDSKGILPRGVYHYWWHSVSPETQAQTVLNALKGQTIEGRVWLDLESTSVGAYKSPEHWQRFCELVEAAGYRTGIYTGFPWWRDNAVITKKDLSYFYARPLWQAWYTTNPAFVQVAGNWGSMMIWQDGTPAIGPEVGVESQAIDHNQWNSAFDFSAEWNLELPQTGATMKQGILTPTTTVLNVRSEPVTGRVITTIGTGDKVYGEIHTPSGWLSIQYIIRANGTRENYAVAYCSANSLYITLTDYTPPAPVNDGITVIVTEGGVTKTYTVKGTVAVS